MNVPQGPERSVRRRRTRARRIFIGPNNVTGSGRLLADELRAQGEDAEFVVLYDLTTHQNADYNFRIDRLPWVLRGIVVVLFLVIALCKYDVFHFIWRSLLPAGLDLPILRLFGKKLLFQYSGSEVRLRGIEELRNPYLQRHSFEGNNRIRDWRKRWKLWMHGRFMHRVIAVRNLNDHVRRFVPARKVLAEPWATNPIRLEDYPVVTRTRREVPVIVHAPSNTGIKGTAYVEAAMESLKARGLRFEYRRIQGMEHAQLQAMLRKEADIVVDQLLFGGFGTLSVEAMAACLPVVVYMIPDVQQRFYPDCPAVNATIETVADRVAWLLEHPEERERLGQEGRRFVETRFDVTRIVRELRQIYDDMGTSQGT